MTYHHAERHQCALILAIVLSVICVLPLQAQESAAERLLVPFTPMPPFMEYGEDSERTGFFIELAKLLSDEIGVPIDFLDYSNVREASAAIVNGDTQLVAGVTSVAAWRATNVFSDKVATDALKFIVLEQDADNFPEGVVRDKRLGVVPPTIGSAEKAILDRNRSVEFESVEAALMSLLIGQVDALLIPNIVAYAIARNARIDGRIRFVGEPIRTTERFVVLHKSRADLLDPINEAIARLEADGRLETLRLEHNINVPPPPPDILTVAVSHSPPYGILSEGNEPSGYAIDLFSDLADLAGIAFQSREVSLGEYFDLAATSKKDVIPYVIASGNIASLVDLTLPIDALNFDILVAPDGPFQTVSDLETARVGALYDTTVVARENKMLVAGFVEFQDYVELDAALSSGDIDAVMESSLSLMAEGLTDRYRSIGPPEFGLVAAVALRPGLGAIRERLNAVIPGYLLSEDYVTLRQQYFGEPLFWTQIRLYSAFGAVAMLILCFLGYVHWQRQRHLQQEYTYQQVELAREQAHSEELGQLVTKLERSNRELDEFAYIASHDLKEPLRGIGINANFLLREELTGKVGERVSRMAELAGRMEQLISDLLFFSRLSQGDELRVVIQTKLILDAIRSDLTEWLCERGGEIIQIGEIPSLRAERIKVKVVLQNLIVNGIKYNDSLEKRVEVGFKPSVVVNGKILKNAIFVKDNGIGIAKEHHDKVFRIFSRLNKSSEYARGTGSGLAFVRKIVEEHGGVIDFTSKVGEGSKFYVTLPLADKHT